LKVKGSKTYLIIFNIVDIIVMNG